MLELQSVTKKLGSYEMLDTSMHIKHGEYMVLVGPSGVGKSVLIEIIAGLIYPDTGHIMWDNKDITLEVPEKRGFAVVYQNYVLFPHLTVRQNITYGLKATGADPQEIAERLQMLAKMLNIDKLLDRKPIKLSGGEQQRVALARALAIKPKLLLLDEPLSALDVNTRLRLRKELKRINKELNITVLHVTHDSDEAIALGDRICVMIDNQVRQIGTPTELFHEPSNPGVAKFLGKRNILPIARVRSNIYLACDQEIYIAGTNGQTSWIWIRPEEILLSLKPFSSSARNQYKCQVTGINSYQSFLEVQVLAGEMSLDTLITHSAFEELGIQVGTNLYATFKSSAIHCF
ncbi:MAG: ATP-binding cassette domain-containing protein [Planctomycetota bacterium]|jgi:molybdate/tungstate transport system ATP-binding protein